MRVRPLVFVAIFIALAAVLVVVRSNGELHPPLPRAAAERAALKDPATRGFLKQQGWTRVDALPLDGQHWRITFFNGAKTVLDASVDRRGRVVASQPHGSGGHAAGSAVAWDRALLFGFAALFVLATGVTPLVRMRNLDSLVLAGGTLAVLLFYDNRLVTWDACAGAALLAYLGLRCAWVGLRADGREQKPATPLYAALLGRVAGDARVRLAAIVVAGLVVASGLITYTSAGTSDVGFAGLAGATQIQRGHIPYGHITNEVVHGDTYPPFTYVMYLPFSLFSPVDDSFDSLQGALDLNLIALIGAAVLAFFAARRRGSERAPLAGLAMSAAWLSCPGVLLTASGGGNDVPTALFVMAALATAAHPRTTSGLLALATAAKLGPVGGLAVYLGGLRGRAFVRATAIAAAVGAAMLILLVALGGVGAIGRMTNALAFQFRRGSFHCVWTQLDAGVGQQIFQAFVITFAAAAVVRVLSARATPSLRTVCAVGAAIILGLQLAANYWTYAYLTWALPLILVALFPPAPPRSPTPAPAVP